MDERSLPALNKKYLILVAAILVCAPLTYYGYQKPFYNNSQVILSVEEQKLLDINDLQAYKHIREAHNKTVQEIHKELSSASDYDDYLDIGDEYYFNSANLATHNGETTSISETTTNSNEEENPTITNSPTVKLPIFSLKPTVVTMQPAMNSESFKLKRRSAPHNHVTFIKTHKCASSTIQNILMRYGYYHQLTFTLPQGAGNHIGWPHPFQKNQIRKTKTQPDIHCYHSVFSQELLAIMPKDAFNLASVRDPFTQMRSAYVYYSWFGASHKTLSQVLNWLVENPAQHSIGGTPAYNPVMIDLGFKYADMAYPDRVDRYIQFLDKTFHFMVVTEYFSESMIILRDMLGWTNKEVATFGTNFRKEGGVAPRGVDMMDTPENREKLYKYLMADKKLYDHFRGKIEKIIAANKEYINHEVVELKRYQQSLMNFCIEKALPTGQIKDQRFKTWGNSAFGYALTPAGLTNQTCIDMAMAELSWVGRLNKYQPRYLSLH